eukprot:gnl/MRDRNA2_/MRDRNA2_67179_c0_seq1.p1 gnl/MRDRNA2_/MRDRNA2_67179_c0~~gnl/MRDRNA2_/MRDRNA2_67179_c0_seq1.p1  ORF type:complete len:210 (+),score=40.20 gnl/MRDRNA2_/MRDRNA2_67179_c0_seq1:105-734(+)
MLRISMLVVVAALVQVYGSEQVVNQVADSQDSMDEIANQFANKLIDRALTELTIPQDAELEDTVLGKPGQLSLPVGNAKPVASMAMRTAPMVSSPLVVFQAPLVQGRGDLQVAYANSKSAKKRILVNERNRLRNSAIKSRFRTIGRKVYAMHKKDGYTPEMEKLAREWESYIDKAQGKNVIPKNRAARMKSQMAKLRKEPGYTPSSDPA